jgi:uncharacterized protein (DUF58 family)
VTARFNHPYVKIFEEERELTVMILVDVSGSNEFGTRSRLKEEMMTEVAAVLAFSAINNNDKVGVIFFSDRVEKFIPPKKGTSHILRIIRELIDFKPVSQKTDISEGLKFLTNALKKRCTSFIISDFIDTGFKDALTIANNKHDLVAVRVFDERETELPRMGIVKMFNKESGKSMWVDTLNKDVRENYRKWWIKHDREISSVFRKSGVDFTTIKTDEDYVKPLVNLFKVREARF